MERDATVTQPDSATLASFRRNEKGVTFMVAWLPFADVVSLKVKGIDRVSGLELQFQISGEVDFTCETKEACDKQLDFMTLQAWEFWNRLEH